MSFNNSEIFSYEKLHKTLHILLLIFKHFIELAQHTKQLRRLVLENFITVINFFFGRKGNLWAEVLGFGLLNIFPPLVPASHFYTMCRIWLHVYMQKLLLAHGGGGDDILKNVFGFLYILM